MLTGQNITSGRRACLSVTLSTTNPIGSDLGSNPGSCGERPGTERLNHAAANVR